MSAVSWLQMLYINKRSLRPGHRVESWKKSCHRSCERSAEIRPEEAQRENHREVEGSAAGHPETREQIGYEWQMVYCFNVMAGSDYILRRFMFYYMEYCAISYIAKSNLLKSSTSFLVVMVTQIGVQKPIRMFDCKHFF